MKKGIWRYFASLSIMFLFFVSLAIAITINFAPLYTWNVDYFGLHKIAGISQTALMKNYHELLNYLNFPWISTLSLSDFPVSKSGAQHFLEVKRLFLFDYAVLLLTFVPTVLFFQRLRKQKKIWLLIHPLKIAAIVPLFLGFFMLIGFDQFFVSFHKILFRNDAWLFNPFTDPIINVLPQEYFFQCFVLAVVLLELFFGSGILLGKYFLRKQKLEMKTGESFSSYSGVEESKNY